MMLTRQESFTTVEAKKMACVRCHAHKIQCRRTDSATCDKCKVAGISCEERLPKKMGRPKGTVSPLEELYWTNLAALPINMGPLAADIRAIAEDFDRSE